MEVPLNYQATILKWCLIVPAGGDSRTPARAPPPPADFSYMDAAITTCPSGPRTQLTVSTSALLVPPLVQPRSAEFPLGVSTVTLTAPGPEISPVVSFTVSFLSVTTFALRTFRRRNKIAAVHGDQNSLLHLRKSNCARRE